jgi:N-methylhydantoinase A
VGSVPAGEAVAGAGAWAGPSKAELATAVRAAFEAEHARRYGHTSPGREVEVVAARLVATLPGRRPALAAEPADPTAPRGRRRIWLDGWHEVDVVARSALGPGEPVPGPAVVEFPEATCLVRPGWIATVDPVGTLVLTRG